MVLCLLGILVTAWSLGTSLMASAQRNVGNPPSQPHCETVRFKGTSGNELVGWLSEVPNSHGSVLLLHAVRGDRRGMMDRAAFLNRAGYTTLAIDLQSHGESIGRQITWGHRESRDPIAAVAWLRQLHPTDRVAVIGTSLGGASALLAGSELKADAMVVEAVFSDLRTAIWNRLEMRLGKVPACVLAPLLSLQVPLRQGIDIDDISPLNAADDMTCPIMVIYGEKDAHARIDEGRRIFEACPHAGRVWWMVPGAGHVDLHHEAGPEYERRVLGFLNSVFD